MKATSRVPGTMEAPSRPRMEQGPGMSVSDFQTAHPALNPTAVSQYANKWRPDPNTGKTMGQFLPGTATPATNIIARR